MTTTTTTTPVGSGECAVLAQLRRTHAAPVRHERVRAFVEGRRALAVLDEVYARHVPRVRALLQPNVYAERVCAAADDDDDDERVADVVDALRTLYSYSVQLREQFRRVDV